MSDLPAEIKVWFSRYPIDYMGTWATTRYPAEAVTYVPKADAEAAVALALEEAAEVVKALWKWDDEGWQVERPSQPQAEAALRALAPLDGLALVAELRAEAREGAMQALASMGQAQEAYEAQLKAEAELAAAQEREAGLRNFVEDFAAAKIDALRFPRPLSPEDELDPVVEAEEVWAWQADARAALAQAPAATEEG